MLSVKILIAVYFSHLLVISYKDLGMCRESLILLEYHKKLELSVYIKGSEGYKVVIDFPVHDPERISRPDLFGPTPHSISLDSTKNVSEGSI